MSTATLSPDELEVLNATADDFENLEQIFQSVRLAHPSTSLTVVAATVHTLVARDLLAPRADENGQPISRANDPSLVWRAWFEMTPLGREAWSSAGREAASAPRPSRKSRFGAWSDIAVDLPLDVFQETRREMSGGSGESPPG